ncbi:C2 domain-containing protein [Vararia minispora EC-137]|uniref:C2 domain-containing protein n=1 Tax=Vararia minispora EC-137 TaxID=1314806 RepID=A0ACB8QW90_9AGAM|nr:C2 domain-containing protein [Vararia minispora EC-137]
MTTTPNSGEIGTLIVVILKARNLPNKRHLGKQAPYCTILFNEEMRRTKVIKRGGQHPEWDEEIRFTLFEDDTPLEDGGGNHMRLSCFADDPREPDLIGETQVDLTEVLTTGETDEWFTLTHRDRYCGEVYLELTFWSNVRPPAFGMQMSTLIYLSP